MGTNTVSDRRLHPRLPLEVEVELYRSGVPMCLARTEDLSHGGVMLLLEEPDRPAIGTMVQVRVCGFVGGECPPMVKAAVVRHTVEGVAVRFVDSAGF